MEETLRAYRRALLENERAELTVVEYKNNAQKGKTLFWAFFYFNKSAHSIYRRLSSKIKEKSNMEVERL